MPLKLSPLFFLHVSVCACQFLCLCVPLCGINNILFRMHPLPFWWAWHFRTSGPLSKLFLWYKFSIFPLNLRTSAGTWNPYGNGKDNGIRQCSTSATCESNRLIWRHTRSLLAPASLLGSGPDSLWLR